MVISVVGGFFRVLAHTGSVGLFFKKKSFYFNIMGDCIGFALVIFSVYESLNLGPLQGVVTE